MDEFEAQHVDISESNTAVLPPAQANQPFCTHCELMGVTKLLMTTDLEEERSISKVHANSVSELSDCSFCRLLAAILPPASLRLTSKELKLIGSNTPWHFASNSPTLLSFQTGWQSLNKEFTGFLYPLNIAINAPQPRTQPQPRPRSESHIDFNVVSTWLQYCHVHHGASCGRVYQIALPYMLIDCKERTLVRSPEGSQYLALSYVWGSAPGNDSRSAAQEFPKLPDLVPLTIEDAITVTRRLGYRYLWVDRYCINQADNENKMSEIRRMDLIYQNALATIIAAAGSDPNYGLPGVSQRHRKKQARELIGSHDIFSIMQKPRDVIPCTKWMSRAWTCQEAILSRRRIYFTDEQVYCECSSVHTSEILDWDLGELDERSDVGLLTRGLFKEIYNEGGSVLIWDTISDYTSRALKYQSDILNAFVGVMRYHEVTLSIRYYWGIPILPSEFLPYANGISATKYSAEQDVDKPLKEIRIQTSELGSASYKGSLAAGLGWTEHPGLAHNAGRRPCPGSRRSDFPSWSWAGWVGKVYYKAPKQLQSWESNVEVKVELADGTIIPWDDLFNADELFANGNLHSRFIHISGLLFEVSLRYCNAGDWYPRDWYPIHGSSIPSIAPGPFACRYTGIYAYFNKGYWHGGAGAPQRLELLEPINCFEDISQDLKTDLQQSQSFRYFGLVLGLKREKLNPLLRDYKCHILHSDLIIILQDHGSHMERIGSLGGGGLQNFTNPQLRAAKRRRFRFG